MRIPLTLWIIHRDASSRAALARVAGADDDAILGAPTDDLFESAPPANVVLLAPSRDFESELEFVHRISPRLPQCTWILLPEEGDLAEAERLFDTLPALFMEFPPQPERLRGAIHDALRRRRTDTLSHRRRRDLLAARFSRWFADLELPDLLRTVDPRLSHVPLLIRGESGTGRGLLAHYVHAFGGSDDCALGHIPCRGVRSEEELLGLIRSSSPGLRDGRQTLWLENAHHLPYTLQSRVRDWVDYGLPQGTLRSLALRWIVSTHDDFEPDRVATSPWPSISRDLADALSGLVLRLPPLRERRDSIDRFAASTATAWCSEQRERLRTFSLEAVAELRAHSWRGNMLELESTVLRTLALCNASPIESRDLRFDLAGMRRGSERSNFDAPTSLQLEELEPTPSGFGQSANAISVPIQQEPPTATAASQPTPDRYAGLRFSEPPSATIVDEDETGSELEDAIRNIDGPLQDLSGEDDESIHRLISALAHEIRNPLVSIRTFSELLPENFEDADFRRRFAELVGADVRQIEAVVNQLQDLSQLRSTRRQSVDLAAMLDELLEAERSLVHDRNLLVLKELDRNHPLVTGDPVQLERAFKSLIGKALLLAPPRGDVYIASKHNTSDPKERASMRVLLRFHNPRGTIPRLGSLDDGIRTRGVSQAETSMDFVVAETLITAQDGKLTIDTTDVQETVIVVDLPTPAGV